MYYNIEDKLYFISSYKMGKHKTRLTSHKLKKSFSLPSKIVDYIIFLSKEFDLNESETLERIVKSHKKISLENKLKEGYSANNIQNKKTAKLFEETLYDSFK